MTVVLLFVRVLNSPDCECFSSDFEEDSQLPSDHDVTHRRHAEGPHVEDDNRLSSDHDVTHRTHAEDRHVEDDNRLASDHDVTHRRHAEGRHVGDDNRLSSYHDVTHRRHTEGRHVEDDNRHSSDHDVMHRRHPKDNNEEGEILCENACGYQCATNTLAETTEQVDSDTEGVHKPATVLAQCCFVLVCQCTCPAEAESLRVSCECVTPSQLRVSCKWVRDNHPLYIVAVYVKDNEVICVQNSSQVLKTGCSENPNECKRDASDGDQKHVTRRQVAEGDTSSTVREARRAVVGYSGSAHDSARAHCGRLRPDSLLHTGAWAAVHTLCTRTQQHFTKCQLTHTLLHFEMNYTFYADDNLVGLILMKMLSCASFCLTRSANDCSAVYYNILFHHDICVLTSVKNESLISRSSGQTAFVISQKRATQSTKGNRAKVDRSEPAHSRARAHCGRRRPDDLSVLVIPYKPSPSLLFALVVDIMFIVIMMWLRLSKDGRQNAKEASLRYLLGSFFNELTISKKDKPARYYDNTFKRVKKKSNSNALLFDVLNDVILQPWSTHVPSHDFARVTTSNTCRRSDDTLCKECRRQLDRYSSSRTDHVTGFLSRRAGQYEVAVRPVLRFLPDTTNNPELDLAHVGYRLATLSALPPTVPVSRVKLADAGFYYRGQDDEVTCYACRGRHSGWTNGDQPWDVHRRISPNCPHVLEAPGGAVASLSPGVSPPSVTAARQDPQSTAPEQAAPQAVTSQSSRLITSHGSSGESEPSPTSPRIPNTVARSPHHMIITHGEDQVEDGDLANPTFTTSAQSSATDYPPNVLQSEADSSENADTPARTAHTGYSGRLATGISVGSRNESATTAAEGANRSRAIPGGNVPGVGSSAAPGEGTNAAPAGGASARQMFPRAGLELGGAVYPMYQDMASRRRSFPRWDETHAPPLDQVILCGMFYAGYADCVRCFYCGVGLKHWEVTDDVWTEHVRWRPTCGYLRAVKGDDFIRRMQARLAREASGNDDNDDGPGDGNDRPPGPQGPPRPQGPPGAPSRDRGPSGDSRSGAGSTALSRPSSSSFSQHGSARTVPPDSQASDTSAVALPRPSTTLSIPSQTTTLTTVATVTAPSTSPASSLPTSAPSAEPSSPPEGGSVQASTRPEGGTGISVVEGETHSQRVARLQAENAELARRLRCKVCHREPIDTIIMPCGHLVVCETCARNTTQCPLCHGRIRATAKVHMS